MKRDATLSPCGLFRFTLTRIWDERPMLLVVMCNPSHASVDVDDQTIKLLMHIASHNGFGGIEVVNMSPLRTPRPGPAIAFADARLRDAAAQAAMALNEDVIDAALARAETVLLAWGSMGGQFGDAMSAMLSKVNELPEATRVVCLGRCANGHPMHPMARGKRKVAKDAALIPWKQNHLCSAKAEVPATIQHC